MGTSGGYFWSQSGVVGSVLQVVSRNSGSRMPRSALLMMSSVARCLLYDGVSSALLVGSVSLSRGGMSHAVPCIRMVPPSSVYSIMLEIQWPGQIRFRQGALPISIAAAAHRV